MRYIIFYLVALIGYVWAVDATLTVEKDVENRARIVIADGSDISHEEIDRWLRDDMKVTGHMLPLSSYRRADFESDVIDASLKSSEYLLRYRFSDDRGARLEVRLQRSSDGKEVFRKGYAVASIAKAPFLIHKAISDINDVLRYPSVAWINRYVIYAVYTGRKSSTIGVADYTFRFRKSVIRGGLNLFPKWADKAHRAFYYTSLNGIVPTLYRIDIRTGKKIKIASSQGMIVCSDVSDDGKRLLLTMAPDGQPDIYEKNLSSGSMKRITRFGGIDVGGKYAGSDDKVVFVSDRLGYANIFVKALSGSGVRPLVYRGRNNNACDAYENRVVYSSRESDSAFGPNTFNIYLTDIDGTQTRPLTTRGINRSPHLCADGNVVAYIKKADGRTYIGYINLQSAQSVLFPVDGDIRSFDW